MNKKLTNVLRTNVTLYFICLVLFALAAIPFDVRLAIGEGAAAVLLLIIARRRSRSVQQSMRQYMDRFTGGMDSARSSNMLFAPLPMMVFDADTQAVVWCNDGFLELTEQKEGVFDAHLNAVVPSFSVRWLLEGKNECPENVVWNHRIYRVYGGLTRPTPDTPSTMATTYWMDVTDSEQLRQTLQMTRPVVAILMVDNYEDLMKACPESKRSAVLAQLEEKLDQWSAGADGLMLHYDRDRYLFVFEERSYSDYAQHRFAVLDTVREVAAGGVAATLSIGVGRDADSFDALFKNASMALEMALSRGGDQAVVKDRMNFQFYGGRAKTTEKRTKVKSRVMANALGELMDDARQVYVMGHSYADMDSLGAAAGVCCIARKRGRKCQIVIDTENNAVHPMLRKLADQPEYHGAFITGSEAFLKVQPGTLLVVVDTNRPGSVESEQLLETCNRVAVIDHHRRAATYIEGAALNYHEPYASSACELVTELLQYIAEPTDLLRTEAEALLAGIVLDTKNFTMRTGGRTFEAAAFLRRSGADTGEVKRLFQNDLSGTIAKYDIIQNAKLYRDHIAIAVVDHTVGRVTAAQAADELLNIVGISTSFVLFPDGEQIIISGRSMGDTNVQVILEQLGGGGNAAAAGGQVAGKTLEQVAVELTQAIDRYLEEDS